MTVSRHPVDELIRELIRSERSATTGEIEQIVERVATASFDPRDFRVRTKYRGISYQGRVLGARLPSLFYHLVKRIAVEGQWAGGTTSQQYLADIRRAVSSPNARLVVYERQAGSVAAVVTPTEPVLPIQRRGPEWLPVFLVIYSADRGSIITGYQISGLETANIPEEARWLR